MCGVCKDVMALVRSIFLEERQEVVAFGMVDELDGGV